MDNLVTRLRGAYSDESRLNLMHYCDLAANEIERLQRENALLKREVLAADAIVMIDGKEMVVPSAVKAEIIYLRNRSHDLERLEVIGIKHVCEVEDEQRAHEASMLPQNQ